MLAKFFFYYYWVTHDFFTIETCKTMVLYNSLEEYISTVALIKKSIMVRSVKQGSSLSMPND